MTARRKTGGAVTTQIEGQNNLWQTPALGLNQQAVNVQLIKWRPRWEVWRDGAQVGYVDKIETGEWVVNCIPAGCACLSHALIYDSRKEAVKALVQG